MFPPLICLLALSLFNFSTADPLKMDKHPVQAPGTQPDFRQSLLSHAPKLSKQTIELRQTQFGLARAGEPNCPDNALCDYAKGKAGLPSKVLLTCGNVILIAPFGSIKDNPSFIKFLAIPKEHVASVWSITDKNFIPAAHQCVQKYLGRRSSTPELVGMMQKGCKGDGACLRQHRELSRMIRGPLQFRDFVTYFHLPPGINHLHMHIALSNKKFRKYSDSHEDNRCLLSDVAQRVLQKTGWAPRKKGAGTGVDEKGHPAKGAAAEKTMGPAEPPGPGPKPPPPGSGKKP